MRTSRWVGAGLILVLLGAAGCGRGPDKAPLDGVGGSASARPSFDPPVRFGPAATVKLPAEAARFDRDGRGWPQGPVPVLLEGTIAYVATASGLLITDLVGGRTDSVAPQNPPGFKDEALVNVKARPPVIVTVDGQPRLLSVVHVQIPGQGTTAAHDGLEIMIVDVSTGKRLRSVTAPVRGDGEPNGYTQIVGAAGNAVVVNHNADTYGIDLGSGEVRWYLERFDSAVVLGELVVGNQALDYSYGIRHLQAVAVADGSIRWSDPLDRVNVRTFTAGPGQVLITSRPNDYEQQTKYEIKILDAATGKSRYQQRGPDAWDLWCVYDQKATTVCSQNDGSIMFAVDASSGQTLWHLPDAANRRTAARLYTAWHGAVYATTGNGPMVLDARTGADRQPTTEIAPYAVNANVGIGWIDNAGLFAYPAAG